MVEGAAAENAAVTKSSGDDVVGWVGLKASGPTTDKRASICKASVPRVEEHRVAAKSSQSDGQQTLQSIQA